MTLVKMIRQMLVNNRKMTLALMADLDGPALFYQGPGGRNNHALWLLAHIAGSEAHLAAWGGAKITVKPVAGPEAIGRGSVPVSEAARYPGKEQVLRYAAAVRRQVLAALDKMTPADFDKPCAGENVPPVLKTCADAWRIIVGQEQLHAGQLTVIRRELALSPVRG